ncbi:uncharacterized protein LOC130046419 isoform X2 [Ostrea edulis]|uniref:uncharacterized protein LOC130046419 isoform X2 n=1 Tax=Ostrea edulis TaxID=37623 RepID=UPI0024AF06FE|nr:uncharacterized protein LOC130046419 isoform X2 [Ostrea edulis]
MRITVMLSLVIGACLSSLMFVYGDGHDYDHNYHHHSSSSSYCNRDSDCTGCHSYQSGHCSNNHCTCIDAKTHCEVDADCLNLCPKETPFQHCRHYNFLLLYWTDCDCKACFEDTDCTCTGETMPHCSHSQGGSACHCLSTIAPTTEPPPTTPTTTTATTTIRKLFFPIYLYISNFQKS